MLRARAIGLVLAFILFVAGAYEIFGFIDTYEIASRVERARESALFIKKMSEVDSAEFLHRLAKKEENGVRFYGIHKARLDSFQRKALSYLNSDVETFWRIENGELRFATAERMRQSCIQCHNQLPESQKHDWKDGDLAGVMEISTPAPQLSGTGFAPLLLLKLALAFICGFLLIALFQWRKNRTLRREIQFANDKQNQKGTYLAQMSHELKTPLNAIIGHSQLLLEEAGDVEWANDVKKINAAGHHLLAVVNGILDASKIEAGKMTYYLETFNIKEVIDGVSTTILPMVKEQKNKLITKIGRDIGSMRADVTKVRQILFNLLGNATKFTSKGEITLTVARKKVNHREMIVFEVKDSGKGMDATVLKKLFTPFEQGGSATASKYGGTGLGLAITKNFVESMGGTISVQSAVGKGSTFEVSLPSHVGDPASSSKAEEKTHFEELGVAQPPVPEETILVVDDDESASSIVSRYLAKEGFQVVTCDRGEEALALADKLQPSLITLDIMMPGIDGWEVLRKLKANPRLKKTHIVVITMLEDNAMAKSLGASDFATKPVSREQLVEIATKFVPKADLSSYKILLVGEEENNRNLIEKTFQGSKLNIARAISLETATAHLKNQKVDLILVDLALPDMEGFRVLDMLRNHAQLKSIPVVVSSGNESEASDFNKLRRNVTRVLKNGDQTQVLGEIGKVAGDIKKRAKKAA